MKIPTALLALLLFLISVQAQEKPLPIRVEVDRDMGVTVTVPDMNKAQLNEMISVFFSRGDEKAEAEFKRQFGKAHNLTLIVTTKPHGGAR
jgi:hypothetical protein